jgi:hypothetical protein
VEAAAAATGAAELSPTAIPFCTAAVLYCTAAVLYCRFVLQEVTESDAFYHFSLYWPDAPSAAANASYFSSGYWAGTKPGRTWVLGCHTRGDRQQWMEAILNAQRPADEQVQYGVCFLWGFVGVGVVALVGVLLAVLPCPFRGAGGGMVSRGSWIQLSHSVI